MLYSSSQGIFTLKHKRVALAGLAVTSALVRGPLAQRASTVENVLVETNGTLHIIVAQNISTIPLGYVPSSHAWANTPNSVLMADFAALINQFSSRTAIELDHSACGDSCTVTVRGFGYAVNCSQGTYDTGYNFVLFPNGTVPESDFTPQTIFSTSIDITSTTLSYTLDDASLVVKTVRPTIPALYQESNQLISNTCQLMPGIIEYPVTLVNGTAELKVHEWQQGDYFVPT